MYNRKTTLVSINKDMHATLRVVAALTGVPMVKLIDEVLVEQLKDMATETSKLGEVARTFLAGRAPVDGPGGQYQNA